LSSQTTLCHIGTLHIENDASIADHHSLSTVHFTNELSPVCQPQAWCDHLYQQPDAPRGKNDRRHKPQNTLFPHKKSAILQQAKTT